MAILIEDMTMPKRCMDCALEMVVDNNGERITLCSRSALHTSRCRENGRPLNCPLVEVDSDNLIDVNKVIHTKVYDDEHEEIIDRSMTIADFLDEYTEEGCPMSVMDVEE